MARRRSSVLDGISAFNQAYDTVTKVGKDIELSQVAKDQAVTTDDRYTPEQGAALESAAKSGAAITYDEGSKSYVVTPADGAANPVAPVKHTTYQGKTVAGEATPDMTAARQSAQAGVLEKYGDLEGADRLRRNASQDKLSAVQLGVAQQQLKSGERAAKKQDAIDKADTVVRTWAEKNVERDEKGQLVLNSQIMVNFAKLRGMALAEGGEFDEAFKTAAEGAKQARSQIELDEADRKIAVRDAVAAVGMGDAKKAIDVYNRFVPNGAQAVDIQPGKDGSMVMSRVSSLDGAQLSPMTFKSQQHLIASLNGLSDSKALADFTENEFKRDIEVRRLNIASAAEGRAQESHRLAVPAAQVASTLGTLRLAYAGEKDPAKKKEIGDSINALQATGGADKDAPAEVKLANAYLRSGLAKTEADALRMATTTKDLSPEKMRFELTKTLAGQIGSSPASVKKSVDMFMANLEPAGNKSQSSLQKGAVVDGFEFQGGDPNDQKNWKKAATRTSTGNIGAR